MIFGNTSAIERIEFSKRMGCRNVHFGEFRSSFVSVWILPSCVLQIFYFKIPMLSKESFVNWNLRNDFGKICKIKRGNRLIVIFCFCFHLGGFSNENALAYIVNCSLQVVHCKFQRNFQPVRTSQRLSHRHVSFASLRCLSLLKKRDAYHLTANLCSRNSKLARRFWFLIRFLIW